jgi:CubicO group peptidase (beta-lactamase class C family)
MKSKLGVLAIGLRVLASVVVIGRREADPPRGAATLWSASPLQAARIARVESQVPPMVIEGEAPIALTLEQWMKAFNVPGLSLAVFERNELVWAKAYGVKQAGGSDPVALDTLFQAGSISKPVTAMAALRFVEAGKWTLDQNINDKLISWKIPENEFTRTEKVTLRRLLSHTAGTTVHGFPGYAVNQPVPTLVQVLDGEKPANTPPVRVDIVPGTQQRYSGGGTTIVQLMMVDQLEKPFPQIMMETVLQPLGLQHSTYEQPLPPDRAARAATGTQADGTSVEGRWHVYPEMAAAGLWTTASDLARIAIEVSRAYGGTSARVLSQSMAKQMLSIQSAGFGLGFALGPGRDQYGHNGSDDGFQAYLTAFADTGSGVAIMANSDNGAFLFEQIAASVASEYKWTSFRARKPPAFATVAILAHIRGPERAIAWYKSAKSAGAAGPLGPDVLNVAGHYLLRVGKTADAVKLFEANVALYPDDANAYDSLAEGQMKTGLKAEAIANYKKSFQLNPTNTNALEMLERLGVYSPHERKQ